MTNPRRAVLAGLLMTAVAAARAEDYLESFTTTTYEDPATSTVLWDTGAGEIRLPELDPAPVGSHATPEPALDVFVSGDLLYTATNAAGLLIFDVRDVTSPTLLSAFTTAHKAQEVIVAGDLAFVADALGGLQIIDVRNPAAPVLVGGIAVAGNALSVAVDGNHAYVADALALRVIGVADPTSPVLVANLGTPGTARGVVVSGRLAYVADDAAGIQVVDVSTPASPTLVGSNDEGLTALGVFVSGDQLFVANGSAGLAILDVSDPTAPKVIGAVDTPGTATHVTVSGDRAYLACDASGLQIVNVSDPTNPHVVGDHPTSGDADGVVVSGVHAFLASSLGGIEIVEVARHLVDPRVVGQFALPIGTFGVEVAGDLAYAATQGGLHIVSKADPTAMFEIGMHTTLDGGRRVTLSGDLAYVSTSGGNVEIVDVRDPASPALVATIPSTDLVEGVVVSGEQAYVASGLNGLRVFDVSTPSLPVLIGSYDEAGPFFVSDVIVDGDLAYIVAGSHGLRILDVTDPSSPAALGSVVPGGGEGFYRLDVAGEHAFVIDQNSSSLRVFDVADPSSPALDGVLGIAGPATDVRVSGNRAYVFAADLWVVDVTDPTSPAIVGGLPPGGSGFVDADVSGEVAYAADFFGGLAAIQLRTDVPNDANGRNGQSLPVNDLALEIATVQMTTTQLGPVSWEVSGNGGGTWRSIVPGGSKVSFSPAGTGLLWRSTHGYDLEINPTCSSLELHFLYAPGVIADVVDVPDDQGGWLRLQFDRSGYDFADEPTTPVTGYALHRRVDDPLAPARATGAGWLSPDELGPETLRDLPSARDAGARIFLDGRAEAPAFDDDVHRLGDLPPGVWEVVGWVPAMQRDSYIGLVPTEGDSSSTGIPWSVYVVTTHTTTPSIWFASLADSAYSTDDVPPAVPTSLRFDAPFLLTWDPAPEDDFAHHSVYGSESADFDPMASLIGYTIEPSFDVSSTSYAYYHVTTSDHADNESDAASIEGSLLASPEDGVPTAFALSRTGPNPFRQRTSLTIALPKPTKVRLVLHDVGGRVVRTLADGAYAAGVHAIAWDARDDAGRPVGPGMYFARIEAGEFEAVRRLSVIR